MCLLLVSCKSLTNLSPSSDITYITKDNFAILSGKYSNRQDTCFGTIEHSPNRPNNENNIPLISRLFMFHEDFDYLGQQSISLEVISPRSLAVSMYQNDTLLMTKTIRGNIRNGYFNVHRKVFLIPIVPLFIWFHNEKVRLSIANNQLILDHNLNSCGLFFIVGGETKGRQTVLFNKCN